MFGQAIGAGGSGGGNISVTGPFTTAGGELSLDITGISGAKRITLLTWNLVHTGGGSVNDMNIIRIGGGGSVQTTGYNNVGAWMGVAGNGQFFNDTAYFRIANQGSGDLRGSAILTLLDETNNVWACNAAFGIQFTIIFQTGGICTLTSALTNVKLTTIGGTQTFNANGKWGYIIE